MSRRRSPARSAASTARKNAAQRGYAFEKSFAKRTGGVVWPGQDGDVDAHGVRVECKYRTDLAAYGELTDHIEQAQRNGKSSGKPWALAITGGQDYQNYGIFVLLPLEAWDRLCSLEDDMRALEHFKHEYGTDKWEQAAAAFYELARQMAEELRQKDGGGGGADLGHPGGRRADDVGAAS